MQYTCVTAPDVTEGPYYINNEKIRYDLSESQGYAYLSPLLYVQTYKSMVE